MSETIVGKLEVKNVDGSFTSIVLDGGEQKKSGSPGARNKKGQVDTKASTTTTSMFSMGSIELKDQLGESKILLNGDGIIALGEKPKGLLANVDQPIVLNAVDRSLTLTSPSGSVFRLEAGKNGGEMRIPGRFHLTQATLRLGAEEKSKGGGEHGVIFLCDSLGKLILSLRADDDSTGEIRIQGGLHARNSTLRLGAEKDGAGDPGELFLCDSNGKPVLSMKAVDVANQSSIFIGGHGKNGQIVVQNDKTKGTIILDGSKGDILLQNADCAEDFDIALDLDIEPGTVVVLDDYGKLRPSSDAYDKKVAGVISGAGDFQPGIVLDKQLSQFNRKPVALVGKVYCKVDATHSPISVGDLLTTSATPGHAMRADDPFKAFGSVIGKALRPLKSGSDLIPILVALQ